MKKNISMVPRTIKESNLLNWIYGLHSLGKKTTFRVNFVLLWRKIFQKKIISMALQLIRLVNNHKESGL